MKRKPKHNQGQQPQHPNNNLPVVLPETKTLEPKPIPKKDTEHRKYTITINNPLDYGFTHTEIHSCLQGMKSTEYYCFSDEIGIENKIPHTHIYIVFSSTVRFSTMRNTFNGKAHIEAAHGSSKSNIEYIKKEGKWADTEKADTSVEGTFEEWGTLPMERTNIQNLPDLALSLIEDGYSDAEIIRTHPGFMLIIDKIQQIRQIFAYEQARTIFRRLDTTYIFGNTGAGKTRYVMEKYGYSAVYKVTDYIHPFDSYQMEDVLLFDEFHSCLRINDMLNFLDGYPLKLPARYTNKTACYTKVYIISNIELSRQYPRVKLEHPDVWNALLRRIHSVVEFQGNNKYIEYATQEYLDGFRDVSSNPQISGVFAAMDNVVDEPKQLKIGDKR